MSILGAAIALEARDGDIAKAGFRLALEQLRWDERDGLPADVRRRRFDEISEATRQLEQQ